MVGSAGSLLSRVALALLAVTLAVGLASLPAAAQEEWQVMAPAPEGEEEVFGLAVGDQVYLMGGLEPLWDPMGLMSVYDTAADEWTVLDRMPVPVHHAGVATVDGRIYMVGGFVLPEEGPPAWVPVDSTWEYDPATDTWTELAPIPAERGSVACAPLDGLVHCVGGVQLPEWSDAVGITPGSEAEHPNEHLVYDPETDEWSTRAPMPTARNHLTLTEVGGNLHAIGGRIGSAFVSGWSTPSSAHEVYDPDTDTWVPAAPLPTPRSAHGSAVVHGRIHVLGGEEWRQDTLVVHRTHEVYDPTTNTWERSLPLPTPRHGFVVAGVENRLYAISGANVAGGGGPHVPLTVNEMLVVGEPPRFTDVAGSPHADAIEAVVDAGIAQGYPDRTFRPGLPITRGQMATLLVAALDLDPAGDQGFTDVAGHTHEDSINAVAAAGIAQGRAGNTFGPNDATTRGQMATFLAAALGL